MDKDGQGWTRMDEDGSGWTRLKPILTVIVLYKMPLAESPTYRALQQIMQEHPALLHEIDLVIADNSPQPCTLPQDFRGTYLHDGRNPGLATRYNQALAIATRSGADWLLLFDQDTTPTSEYFLELTGRASNLLHEAHVHAIIPKLRMHGRIMSPHEPLYRKPVLGIGDTTSGVLDGLLRVFNSGALVRVTALQAIGGFDLEYTLDFLDHATFHRLQEQGGKVYIMRSMLEHDLSVSAPDSHVDPVRLANRLAVEERFHTEFGSRKDRVYHRFDLLRQVIGHGRRGRFQQALLRFKILLHLG